jgi:uncharacterized MAPEG superfamily protein
MPMELSYLTASVIVFLLMILVQGAFSNRQHTPKQLAGNRDDLPADNVRVARAKRANQNMIEALVLFAPLVLVAVVTDRTNQWTQIGAGLFLAARIAYAPLYWFGGGPLRSLAWAIGLIGTLMILFQILPFTGAA